MTTMWFVFLPFVCLGAVAGGWSNWTSWSTCSHSCNGGTQTRTRFCNSRSLMMGDAECFGESAVETFTCNEAPCPITRTACEDATLHIECPDGSVIEVIDAVYGRQDEVTCPGATGNGEVCSRELTTDWVQERCQDETSCDIIPPTDAPGCADTVRKYLEVIYVCNILEIGSKKQSKVRTLP